MIPTTTKEYKDTLLSILDLNTFYRNEYPYNLGYYHSSGKFSFDCVNLIKAILNGWEANKTVGYFVRDLSRTGDCNELGLINQCINVSSDFTKLKDVSVLYTGGHIGTYLGLFQRGNKFYNSVEANYINENYNGVFPTWCDENGVKWTYKGSGVKLGSWKKHGTMQKWLKYEDTKPFDYGLALRIAVKIERGDYGNNPDRKKYITDKYGAVYYEAAQHLINELHKLY